MGGETAKLRIRRLGILIAVAASLVVLLLAWQALRSRPVPGESPTLSPRPAGDVAFASIGTGAVTGVYYQVGGAIMKLVNAKQAEYGLNVTYKATEGSVYNIDAVLNGVLDFGVVQSDRQYQAYNGLAEWTERGMQTDLRAVCSFYPEAVTLVAGADTDIRALENLKGKRVAIGAPESGLRGNALDVLSTFGLDWKTDIQAEGMEILQSIKALQDGQIDAFFYTVGHPARVVTEATSGTRKVRFVPISGMENLIRTSPYYAAAKIQVKLYPKAENTEDVPTIGVMTTLVTSARMPDRVVYCITREIFQSLTTFKAMHPAFADLTPTEMATHGISAPLHVGAQRYFREAGLIKN
jgi:TRAP transporter TAXI family solute receptor